MKKERLDEALVRLQYADTPELARAIIMEGRVFQNGKMVGDGGSAGAELFGYLTGAFRPSAQQLQDLAAGGVGQGFERFVEHARTAPSAAFLSTLV